MTLSGFAFIFIFRIIFGEILTFNDRRSVPDIIECTDASTDCIINCMNTDVCTFRSIHCHRTSTNSICKINLTDRSSARFTSLYTHQSPIVYINVIGDRSCRNCKIYAHEQLGSKLYIYVVGNLGMVNASVYAPVGEGSLLSRRCGGYACTRMKVYDDWTTEIFMEPLAVSQVSGAFSETEIKNIFNNL